MGTMFNKKGRLNIPLNYKMSIPKTIADEDSGNLFIKEAFCSQGHNLISDVKINDQNGINFIYTDQNGGHESNIVISSFTGNYTKVRLSGDPFQDGEIVKIFCPECHTELPILYNCECGAPIYLFYIDKRLYPRYGQSFCARIGCVKSSQLRFSMDALSEFETKYAF